MVTTSPLAEAFAGSTPNAAATPIHLAGTADRITIGPGPRCTHRTAGVAGSPVQCLVVRAGSGYTVRRWGDSAKLNGSHFDEAPFHAGDQLEVGGHQFVATGGEWSLELPTIPPAPVPEVDSETLRESRQAIRKHLAQRITSLVRQIRSERQQKQLLQSSLLELSEVVAAQRLIVEETEEATPEPVEPIADFHVEVTDEDAAQPVAPDEVAAPASDLDWLLDARPVATPVAALPAVEAALPLRTIMLDSPVEHEPKSTESPVEPADIWKNTWQPDSIVEDEPVVEPRHSEPALDACAEEPTVPAFSASETRKTNWNWDIEAPSVAAASAELWQVSEPTATPAIDEQASVAESDIYTVEPAVAVVTEIPLTESAEPAVENEIPTEYPETDQVVDQVPAVPVVEEVVEEIEEEAAARVDELFAPKAVEHEDPAEPTSFIAKYAHLIPDDAGDAPAPPKYEPQPAAVVAHPAAEEDDSVEAYMAQMLQRLRGQSEPAAATPTTPKLEAATPSRVVTAPAAAAIAEPAAPKPVPFRSLEELQRSQAPERADDLKTLREVANSSARTAIGKAHKKQHRDHAAINLAMSGIGLAAGGFVLATSLQSIGLQTILGAVLMTGSTWWGSRAMNRVLAALRELDQAHAE